MIFKFFLPLLLSTLALRSLNSLDRYIIELNNGPELLGAYTLFSGIANAVHAFLDAGVFVFSYPALIASHRSGDEIKFKREMRRLTLHTVVTATALSLIAILLIEPTLLWLDKRFYQDRIAMFDFILLGIWLFCMSMVPHYGLYARGADKSIIISHLIGLLAFLFAAWVFVPKAGEIAVPLSLCFSYFFILVAKLCSFGWLEMNRVLQLR